jgi:hypothetical protein
VEEFSSLPGSYSYCHYVVRNNEAFRRCHGDHDGFNMFPDNVFGFLSRVVELPDTEFLMNLGDWPLVRTNKQRKTLIPMFSWCKKNGTADIMLPTYEITEASIECMGRFGDYSNKHL